MIPLFSSGKLPGEDADDDLADEVMERLGDYYYNPYD
jgi:hypothetical protein